jgi:hypothetical protein
VVQFKHLTRRARQRKQTRKTLDWIGNEIKTGLLSDFVASRLPLNIAKHLELHRIIISKSMAIPKAVMTLELRSKVSGRCRKSQPSQQRYWPMLTLTRKSVVVVHGNNQSSAVTLSDTQNGASTK